MVAVEPKKTVDDYVKQFKGVQRERVDEMRTLIKQQLPDADERISYGIPAYFVHGKLVVYFAGYENHIGMYPGRTNSSAYNKLAAKYAYGKSTARFRHTEPLPKDIVKEYIETRLEEAQLHEH